MSDVHKCADSIDGLRVCLGVADIVEKVIKDHGLVERDLVPLLIREVHDGEEDVLKIDLVIGYTILTEKLVDDPIVCHLCPDLLVLEHEGQTLRHVPLHLD